MQAITSSLSIFCSLIYSASEKTSSLKMCSMFELTVLLQLLILTTSFPGIASVLKLNIHTKDEVFKPKQIGISSILFINSPMCKSVHRCLDWTDKHILTPFSWWQMKDINILSFIALEKSFRQLLLCSFRKFRCRYSSLKLIKTASVIYQRKVGTKLF